MMTSNEDKKFKPQNKPIKENRITSLYRVTDQKQENYYAKFFLEQKIHQLNIFQSTEYNQTVLSDLSDQIFPEHFLQIKYTYSIPEGFIFVTDPFECSLDSYMKNKVIDQKQAMKIFEQIIKATYSLYMAGFWHRNIRPEHFVKCGNTWKMQSLVFNELYKEANGTDSEYIWNPAYQPPEAYEKQDFSEEELDEMIVWNLGSLLLDILLSHHKLKDKSVLDKFKGKPFSFKALGVKKAFSNEITELLAKMLHYNKKERMTIAQMFSSEAISREVARLSQKGDARKPRIYVAGQSQLSSRLAVSSERSQEVLTVSNFQQKKEQIQEQYSIKIKKPKESKIQTEDQLLNRIKTLAKEDLDTISEYSMQNSQASKIDFYSNKKMDNFITNPRLMKAIQAYKCYYDKCELLLISATKICDNQQIGLSKEISVLSKYAITFTSMMFLHRFAQSMNRNLNYLELEPELWSEFQQSSEFKGLKQIVNFRKNERKNLLNTLRQKIELVNEKTLLGTQQIQDFVHCNYKLTKYEHIKTPYRKILKCVYDSIVGVYNQRKTQQLAKIGMYITYCIAIDKLYIPADLQDNFMSYSDWCKIEPTDFVHMDKFQEYLQNADKLVLVSHSSYILTKYFNIGGYDDCNEQNDQNAPEEYWYPRGDILRGSTGQSFY